MARKQAKTGAARMLQRGMKPSQVWFSTSEMSLMLNAACIEQRPLANFIKLAAIEAAQQLVRRHDAILAAS